MKRMGTSTLAEIDRFERLLHAVTDSPEAVPELIRNDPLMLEATSQSAETALHWFAVENNVAAMELLLKLGARIPEYALQHSIEAGNVEAVEMLLNAGAAITKVKFESVIHNPAWGLSSEVKERLARCFEVCNSET